MCQNQTRVRRADTAGTCQKLPHMITSPTSSTTSTSDKNPSRVKVNTLLHCLITDLSSSTVYTTYQPTTVHPHTILEHNLPTTTTHSRWQQSTPRPAIREGPPPAPLTLTVDMLIEIDDEPTWHNVPAFNYQPKHGSYGEPPIDLRFMNTVPATSNEGGCPDRHK
jgi:hypothetical protein